MHNKENCENCVRLIGSVFALTYDDEEEMRRRIPSDNKNVIYDPDDKNG